MRIAVLLSYVAVFAWSSAVLPTEAPHHWADARQMIVVTTDGWQANHGTLRTYVRGGSSWKEEGSAADVVIGKNGSAWGSGLHPLPQDGPQKHEGDNRSPAGVFHIGKAFGYAASQRTAMPYTGLTAADYCVDVDGSPYYNQLVDTDTVGKAAVAGSTEPMRRDLHLNGDHLYRLGFVIQNNPDNRPGGGSCIFAHLWRASDSTTAGCTAMTDATMERLLAWLDPKANPVFVLLPRAEYMRLRDAWRLPPP